MQLYPHWLDGEFVRIASEEAGPALALGEAVRPVKLHALLGTQFLLNDVQIFDSLAVLQLFSDPKFRAFVKGDTEFLDMRVELDPKLGDHPYALAARGADILVRRFCPRTSFRPAQSRSRRSTGCGRWSRDQTRHQAHGIRHPDTGSWRQWRTFSARTPPRRRCGRHAPRPEL